MKRVEKSKEYLYAVEPFIRWRKTPEGEWESLEYPAGTKVEIIGSGPRGYVVKIVETDEVILETDMTKWSQDPVLTNSN